MMSVGQSALSFGGSIIGVLGWPNPMVSGDDALFDPELLTSIFAS